MLNMTRWTPWSELAGLHRDLDSIFDRVMRESGDRRAASLAGLSPAADVRRVGDTWMISLALPGVSPDKVEVEVVGRTLRVCGERAVDAKGEPVLSEIRAGRFEREFTLPDEVDTARIDATCRHGMLELVLPLSEQAKPHRIAVKAESGWRQLVGA